MSGKRYPEEFKIEVVKQVVERGHSVFSVATHLDITTHSLHAWIKKCGPDSSTNKEKSDAQAETKHTAGQFGNRPNAGIEPQDSLKLLSNQYQAQNNILTRRSGLPLTVMVMFIGLRVQMVNIIGMVVLAIRRIR